MGGGDFTLADIVSAEAKQDGAEVRELREDLAAILATLSAREVRIIEMRWGLRDGNSHTLLEVGQRFGLTRERIRQIEAAVFEKLRDYHSLRRWLEGAA